MGTTNNFEKLEDNISLSKDQLQAYYWQFVQLRQKEIFEKKLTARITIEFSAGNITQVYDNIAIAGISVLDYYVGKMLQ